MKCPFCDHENEEGVKFCEECGRPIHKIEEEKR